MAGRVIVEPLGGLTNKLLAVTSMMRLADVFNREFLICWNPLPDCNVQFRDLFDNDFTNISRADIDADARVISIGFGAQGWNRDPILPFPTDDRDLWVTTHGVITHAKEERAMPYFAPNSPVVFELWRYFKVLQIRKEITDRVAAMKLDRRRTVGLHIRRPQSVNAAIPLHVQQIDRSLFRMIPDDYYAGIVDLILEADPSVSVLLCTNSSETESAIRRRFGNKIIAIEKPTIDDTTAKESAIDAMIEMLLLSQTFGIVRHDPTNFAWFAGLINLLPNLIVRVVSPPDGPPDFVLVRYVDNGRIEFFHQADALPRLLEPRFNKLRY
jgi:hypothetical protein